MPSLALIYYFHQWMRNEDAETASTRLFTSMYSWFDPPTAARTGVTVTQWRARKLSAQPHNWSTSDSIHVLPGRGTLHPNHTGMHRPVVKGQKKLSFFFTSVTSNMLCNHYLTLYTNRYQCVCICKDIISTIGFNLSTIWFCLLFWFWTVCHQITTWASIWFLRLYKVWFLLRFLFHLFSKLTPRLCIQVGREFVCITVQNNNYTILHSILICALFTQHLYLIIKSSSVPLLWNCWLSCMVFFTTIHKRF